MGGASLLSMGYSVVDEGTYSVCDGLGLSAHMFSSIFSLLIMQHTSKIVINLGEKFLKHFYRDIVSVLLDE